MDVRWDVDLGWNETTSLNKRFGSFVATPEAFDAAFFGLPQPEAQAADAQQRLLLETSYEALQGACPRELTGKFSPSWVILGSSLCSKARSFSSASKREQPEPLRKPNASTQHSRGLEALP